MDNPERVGELMQLFNWDDGMAQAVLDLINLYRKPGTPEYTGLAEVSDARIRYWVQYEIKTADEYATRWNEPPHPVIEHYRRIDAELGRRGVKATSEGWGFIKDYGFKRIRDTK